MNDGVQPRELPDVFLRERQLAPKNARVTSHVSTELGRRSGVASGDECNAGDATIGELRSKSLGSLVDLCLATEGFVVDFLTGVSASAGVMVPREVWCVFRFFWQQENRMWLDFAVSDEGAHTREVGPSTEQTTTTTTLLSPPSRKKCRDGRFD